MQNTEPARCEEPFFNESKGTHNAAGSDLLLEQIVRWSIVE